MGMSVSYQRVRGQGYHFDVFGARVSRRVRRTTSSPIGKFTIDRAIPRVGGCCRRVPGDSGELTQGLRDVERWMGRLYSGVPGVQQDTCR